MDSLGHINNLQEGEAKAEAVAVAKLLSVWDQLPYYQQAKLLEVAAGLWAESKQQA